jgi:hypothetical protein
VTALAEPPVDTPAFQAGIYRDMPEDVYHADPVPGGSLSFSGAKKLLPPSCPARYFYDRAHPPKPSPAMELGTAAHKLTLGAGSQIVVVDAGDWRTKAAQDEAKAARAAGKVPLLPFEYAQAEAMATAVREHPVAGRLFDPDYGAPEQSAFWQDPETGVWLRLRADWLPFADRGRRMIITDLKTTVSAEPGSIAKSVWNFRYFQQDAWYSDGIRALGYDDDPAFVFVFVESAAPYLVTVIQLDDDARDAGRAANRKAIERYRDCMECGIWPGYDQDIKRPFPGASPAPTASEIELISLPPWALRQLETL